MPKPVILFALIFLLLPALINAQDLPDEPVGHVNDFAHILSNGEKQKLETKLRNYRDTTTTVIAIATLKSLNGYPIEEVAGKLFNKWKMWQGNKDNGILILVSQQDHKIRIEVGYGLEGAVTDVMAGRIIRRILSPAFKKGNFYNGFDRATTALIELASGEYTGHLTTKKSSRNKDDTASAIIFFLFIFFVIYASSRKGGGGKNGGKRRRTLGPGGFIFLGGGGGMGGSGGGMGGGGFGGFSGGGGFGSGGGGASGGW